ncbi:MAG TPA: crossover junction endodeoxyribonuclease RuvC [Burkholderiaceae bacterium]|nr:crossover junction endodeoxyribonuclease RuvC [Burkholderiaceae bacterium]
MSRIILGIDPGLRRTGFGLLACDGARLRYLASGVIRSGDGALGERLHAIVRGLTEVIAAHRPTEAAIEKVFVNVNPQSTLLLGQARGAAIAAAVVAGLPVHEFTALQLKQAVVGHGHATKAQIQAMVQRLLALPGAPGADAADALACAICQAHAATLAAAVGARLPAPRARARGRGLRIKRGRLSAL